MSESEVAKSALELEYDRAREESGKRIAEWSRNMDRLHWARKAYDLAKSAASSSELLKARSEGELAAVQRLFEIELRKKRGFDGRPDVEVVSSDYADADSAILGQARAWSDG